jgi:hypothetical protein
MQDVKRTIALANHETRGCDHCDEELGDNVSASINHFIQVHGYRLLNVGTETTQDSDGNLRHSTVAILGHHDPPPLNMPAEIRVRRVIPDPKSE